MSDIVAPNVLADGRIAVTPGSKSIQVEIAPRRIGIEEATDLSDAFIDAAGIAHLQLGPEGSTLHSATATIEGAKLVRKARSEHGSLVLSLELRVRGYLTTLSLRGEGGRQVQELLVLLDKWSLHEVVGQDVEVLYSNDQGTDGQFLISNGSIARAVRHLSSNPSIILY